MSTGTGKPVIALMGEFSAGKSTLANFLIGQGMSPVKVTATQLPPVWFTHGQGNAVVVDLDGNETEIEIDALEDVEVATTSFVRVPAETEILEIMDIMDMPGNSDPNMSAEVWQRAIHHATGVIWCSHATQAWRQSEAAVWDEMPEDLYQSAILLLTRFDKISGDIDRARVLRRVSNETDGLFRAVLPISLLEALAAGEDREKFAACGAEAFLSCLLDIAMGTSPEEDELEPEPDRKADDCAGPVILPRRVKAPVREDGESSAAQRPVA